LLHYRERINNFLTANLPAENIIPVELHQAIRYAVLGGGKRIRAALVYATGEALGAKVELLDKVAAAVELAHAYSLVHDDLPAMDNDELRHGMPSCHKKFGEAMAILTGDALQALAFEMLASANKNIPADICVKMIIELANAIGSMGMVGGQVLDLAAEGKQITLSELETIHKNKTGALITASVQLGALVTGCKDVMQLENLRLFAQNIGLAFQVQDDILDIESSTEVLGKQQGADLENNKATYPALLGLSAAKEKLNIFYQQALHFLQQAKIIDMKLQVLAEFIIQRRF
jgi:geranylgeranyl pyrophosphate synthase